MISDKTSFYLQLQKDAEEIVEKAATLLVSKEHSFSIVTQKDDVDIATSADIEAEKLIIDAIHLKYPDHGIDSEERGKMPGKSSYVWVIDPLDGTKEYARGVGEYNCLLAVEENERLVVGVTRRIGLNTLYSCSNGNGAFRDGKPIKVSANDNLSTSIIGFHIPNKKKSKNDIRQNLNILEKLICTVYRVRPGWDTAKQFGWVAQGTLDAHIVPSHIIKWCDVASTILLVEEAGGKVTNFHGNPVKGSDYNDGIIASNGKLHEQLLSIINKSK